jgi:hypothetical protein
MTCAASTSEMIGVALAGRELSRELVPCCAIALAHAIAQMNRVGLNITFLVVQRTRLLH